MTSLEIYHAAIDLAVIPFCIAGIYICIKTKSGSFEFQWLLAAFWMVGAMNVAHAIAPLIGSHENPEIFLPATWLIIKVVYPFLVWGASSSLHKGPGYAATFAMTATGLGALLALEWLKLPVLFDSVIGRPFETIPAIFGIVVITDILRRKGAAIRVTILVLSLFWFVVAQFVMSFSTALIDSHFIVAHWLFVVSVSVLTFYSWLLHSIAEARA